MFSKINSLTRIIAPTVLPQFKINRKAFCKTNIYTGFVAHPILQQTFPSTPILRTTIPFSNKWHAQYQEMSRIQVRCFSSDQSDSSEQKTGSTGRRVYGFWQEFLLLLAKTPKTVLTIGGLLVFIYSDDSRTNNLIKSIDTLKSIFFNHTQEELAQAQVKLLNYANLNDLETLFEAITKFNGVVGALNLTSLDKKLINDKEDRIKQLETINNTHNNSLMESRASIIEKTRIIKELYEEKKKDEEIIKQFQGEKNQFDSILQNLEMKNKHLINELQLNEKKIKDIGDELEILRNEKNTKLNEADTMINKLIGLSAFYNQDLAGIIYLGTGISIDRQRLHLTTKGVELTGMFIDYLSNYNKEKITNCDLTYFNLNKSENQIDKIKHNLAKAPIIELNLRHNYLQQNEGAQAIKYILEQTKTIKRVYLDYNTLKEEELAIILSALKSNTTITEIVIDSNSWNQKIVSQLGSRFLLDESKKIIKRI